jgi:hypothetical protein
MRESRTYGSGRGACDEAHVPTATKPKTVPVGAEPWVARSVSDYGGAADQGLARRLSDNRLNAIISGARVSRRFPTKCPS